MVLLSNKVTSLNRAAMEQGLVVGIGRREAQARCPMVELHEYDENRDARLFEAVLGVLEQLVPRLEVSRPGLCAFPTRGPSRYHGGDQRLAALVLRTVRETLAGRIEDGSHPDPCPIGVGVADGPQAAAIAAEESLSTRSNRGLLVIPPDATAKFLSTLPIERLVPHTLDAESVDLLRRLGLRTMGRFAALPAPDVLARFGTAGIVAHRLVSGSESEPSSLRGPAMDFRVSTAIDPPAERIDRAAFIAKALADTLHSELASRGLVCDRVLVVAETDAGDRIERLWSHTKRFSAGAIAQRVRWQLEGWLDTGRSLSRSHGGVSRLELIPDQVCPDDGVQLGFWGGSGEQTERAVKGLARVQAMLGPEAVLVPEWQGGRAPSEQYRLVPLETVDLSTRQVCGDQPWPGRLPAPSPAVIWHKVRSVNLLDDRDLQVGVSGHGLISSPPRLCSIANSSWQSVRAWAGPWCVDERWWDPVAHRRRARIQVVLDPVERDDSTNTTSGERRRSSHPSSGVAHILVLEGGQWWLEATYD